ncbi:Peptidyl-alpha-hydroxyglycine alpha-amidating lyase 2 [Blattella germanica]|nr:Peptidyl-alpha-hydroxyglycine alpha-amidating lyase 2 [Blattella germanica]
MEERRRIDLAGVAAIASRRLVKMAAILWLVLGAVSLVALAQGRPEGAPVRDLGDEFYSEVRELLNRHAAATAQQVRSRVAKWPRRPLPRLGQVTGVAVNSLGQPVVFHRGPRVWDASSFNASHHFQHVAEGPIAVSTVLTLDPDSGAVLSDWGSNLFFMPHGLAIDSRDNTWLTDVALHQVFKFAPGQTRPSLVLGQRLEPGSGSQHLCQPTSVAVSSSGEFFVADGYCNSRVLHLSAHGRLVRVIPRPPEFLSLQVPHGVALIEAEDLLCIADRENMRVTCPRAGLVPFTSAPPATIQAPDLGRVFDVAALGEFVYAVNGPTSPLIPVSGFTLDPRSESVLDRWGPKAVSTTDSYAKGNFDMRLPK